MPKLIEIVDRSKSYRPDSARQKWLERLTEYDCRPLNEFLSSVTQDPPSTPTKGKRAGQLEPPSGWIRFFKNEGVLRLVRYDASLRRTLKRIVANWADYRRKRKVDKTANVHIDVTVRIPQIIRSVLGQEAFRFKVEGSTGRGNIAAAPRIAVFETSVTTSAASGFYPVYLFSTDMARLYLALSFGTRQFTKALGTSRGRKNLTQAVSKIRSVFNDRTSADHDIQRVDLIAKNSRLQKDYEDAIIYCWREYEIATLPSDKELLNDLRDAMDFYDGMIADPLMPSVADLVAASAPAKKHRGAGKSVAEVASKPRRKKKRSTAPSTKSKARRRRSTQAKKVGDVPREENYQAEVVQPNKLRSLHPTTRVMPHYKIGEMPGWDIASFDQHGDELVIEVVSTDYEPMSAVECTRNEWQSAQDPEYREQYFLYLVMGAFARNLRIEKTRNTSEHVKNTGLSIERSVFPHYLSVKYKFESVQGTDC